MSAIIYDEEDLGDKLLETVEVEPGEFIQIYYCKISREYNARWWSRKIAAQGSTKNEALREAYRRGKEDYDPKLFLD